MYNIVRNNGSRLVAVFVQIFPAFINITHVKWKSKKIQKEGFHIVLSWGYWCIGIQAIN